MKTRKQRSLLFLWCSILLFSLVHVGMHSGQLFAHAADERSHQVITFLPDTSGANIHFDLYCGTKLSQTLLIDLKMVQSQPELLEDKDFSHLPFLLGKEPWIEVKGSGPHGGSELTRVSGNSLLRHQLHRNLVPQKSQNFHRFDLVLQPPGRAMNTWVPKSPKSDTPKELLWLRFTYRLEWPQNLDLEKGILVTIDTQLRVYSSNSVFEWVNTEALTLTSDALLKKQDRIDFRSFLNEYPSNRFKLRRALFFISSAEEA